MRRAALLGLAFALTLVGPVRAAADRPTVYALISAVGDTFSFVRQKQEVGSHLEPYHRESLKVMGNALDLAVLKGLDRVLAEKEPDSRRIFMRLDPLEMRNAPAHERDTTAIGKLVAALEKMPQRAEWDKIIVVTPKMRFADSDGMGSKLQGLGIYVQPLHSGTLPTADFPEMGFDDQGEQDAVTPDGKAIRAKRFVAPFAFTQLWIFDAKNLELLQAEERRDYQKIFDPDSTALDVQSSIPPEKLAERVVAFVERASARALREAVGVVTIGEPRVVPMPPRQ